jgi:hypothetical protein
MFSNGAMHKVASCSMQQINVCVVCFDILWTSQGIRFIKTLSAFLAWESLKHRWLLRAWTRGRRAWETNTGVFRPPTVAEDTLESRETTCSRCIPSRTRRPPSGMFPYPPIPSPLLSELEKCCCVMDCLVELNLRMHITTESLKFAHSTNSVTNVTLSVRLPNSNSVTPTELRCSQLHGSFPEFTIWKFDKQMNRELWLGTVKEHVPLNRSICSLALHHTIAGMCSVH